MAVFRIHKTNDFTVMSRHHLRNKDISLKAKGLLSIMLSLPDDWDYSIMGLASLSKDGKDAVMTALNELSTAGYVDIESIRNERGQYESIYNVYENPNRKNRCGKSESENPLQYNIDNSSTKTDNLNVVDNNSSRIINNTSKNNISTPKEKGKKEFDLSFVGIEYRKSFEDWLKYKAARRESYQTQQSLELCYTKLLKLSNNDPYTAQQIVEQSMANNWAGLFELNHGSNQTKQQANNGFNSNPYGWYDCRKLL